MEVVMIANEAAREVRPITAQIVARLCSDHNTGTSADAWKMFPPSGKGFLRVSEGLDRPIPRNRPCLPSSRGFSIAAAIYEAMDPGLPRGDEVKLDGKVRDYATELLGIGRMGIIPTGMDRMFKRIGFKGIQILRTMIREEVLRTQHKRLHIKRIKRAYRVFDDMG